MIFATGCKMRPAVVSSDSGVRGQAVRWADFRTDLENWEDHMKTLLTSLAVGAALVTAPVAAVAGGHGDLKYVLVSHAPDSDTWWNTIKNGISLAGEQVGVEVKASRKGGSERLTFELSWRTNSRSDLKISSS